MNKLANIILLAGIGIVAPSLISIGGITSECYAKAKKKEIVQAPKPIQQKKATRLYSIVPSSYIDDVINYKGPQIIGFYDSNTNRSPQSKTMLNVMEQLASKYTNIRFSVYDVTKDSKPGLDIYEHNKKTKGIKSIPILVARDGGKLIGETPIQDCSRNYEEMILMVTDMKIEFEWFKNMFIKEGE